MDFADKFEKALMLWEGLDDSSKYACIAVGCAAAVISTLPCCLLGTRKEEEEGTKKSNTRKLKDAAASGASDAPVFANTNTNTNTNTNATTQNSKLPLQLVEPSHKQKPAKRKIYKPKHESLATPQRAAISESNGLTHASTTSPTPRNTDGGWETVTYRRRAKKKDSGASV